MKLVLRDGFRNIWPAPTDEMPLMVPRAPTPTREAASLKAARLRNLVDVAFPPGTTMRALASDVQADLSARDAEITTLRASHKRQESELAELRKKLEASEGARKIHIENLLRAEERADDLAKRLEEAERRSAGLQREHDLTARVATEQRARADAAEKAAALATQDRDDARKITEKVLAERDALAKFKAYVHAWLDKESVPTHPDGEHSKEGCRVGDRLELLRDCVLEFAARAIENDCGIGVQHGDKIRALKSWRKVR